MASAAVSVERFFQLVAAGPGGQRISGGRRVRLSRYSHHRADRGGPDFARVVDLRAGPAGDFRTRHHRCSPWRYAAFFALDYFLLSRDFLSATVHLLFFLAVMKILTARTNRDYLYTAIIAFLELLAAAILSINFNFFLFLSLYLLFAIAALTSGEIRRSIAQVAPTTARSGLATFRARGWRCLPRWSPPAFWR